MRRNGPASRASQQGLTLVESCIGLVIAIAVLGALNDFLRDGFRSSSRTAAAAGTSRTLATASELIRHDLERLVLQNPAQDLAVFDGGRSFSIRISSGDGQDLWATRLIPVTYRLEKAGASSAKPQLIRTEGQASRRLSGIQISDLIARVERTTDGLTYLSVTLVVASGQTVTVSAPLGCITPPEAVVVGGTQA